uniref:hypothetical protein n=1 Tax=Enhygromyxa salina TaxID=215803 RepID=UPI001C639DE8
MQPLARRFAAKRPSEASLVDGLSAGALAKLSASAMVLLLGVSMSACSDDAGGRESAGIDDAGTAGESAGETTGDPDPVPD